MVDEHQGQKYHINLIEINLQQIQVFYTKQTPFNAKAMKSLTFHSFIAI